ncbi:HAMP domain-containing histidine kinase [Nocardia otitidiscaviarum]|uniref:sensor histidine kinase n=1 Tax=Nocardia otitidiscaviarum TaxID=1823 RepID=UPI001893C7DA|nr:HAMP domain-containing sensor histidine kinase [Nocardia otitidiscaviarum]MBF6239953.1 HAMP domain-containing histidine kinase [Nocardia otitidiscaviarum]
MADGRRPWWWRSVRARTTSVATAVVAAAMVTAGAAVLMVLRHNLIDSASLQAEMTAREVAAQLTTGVGFANLVLPDGDSQPVQVVSADGRVLAADDDLSGLPPIANFAATPRIGYANHDEDGVWDDGVLEPGAVANATFRDMKLPVAEEDTGSNDFRVAAIATTTPSGLPVTIYSATSLATADRAMIGVRDTMLIGLPLLLTLVAAVTWLVTARALRPVEAIRAELAEIMGGDLSRRVPESDTGDEIARLAATTNLTLAALDESARQQRRFIADAAHELRSPIASLRAHLEVAQAHPPLLDLDSLITDTVRLEQLATDLLLLARLDAGERPRLDHVDLAALTRDELSRRIGDRHPIRTDLPDRPVPVLGSRIQLGRVLHNLVDNAQRHAAGRVSVTVVGGGRVVLTVGDDGPGVPKPDRQRIFERFVRLDNARSRDDGGAGLGLAIVGDVVVRHGGTIQVDENPGGGACFSAVFPAAPDKTLGPASCTEACR